MLFELACLKACLSDYLLHPNRRDRQRVELKGEEVAEGVVFPLLLSKKIFVGLSWWQQSPLFLRFAML